MSCKCDMRTKLVGDGCEACNPSLTINLLREERDELAEINKELIEVLTITKGHIKELCTVFCVPLPESTISRIDGVLAKAEQK